MEKSYNYFFCKKLFFPFQSFFSILSFLLIIHITKWAHRFYVKTVMESNHYETPFTMDDFSYKKCFRKIKHCISLLYRWNLCSAFIGQRLDKSYLFPVSHDVMQRLGMYTTSLDQTNSYQNLHHELATIAIEIAGLIQIHIMRWPSNIRRNYVRICVQLVNDGVSSTTLKHSIGNQLFCDINIHFHKCKKVIC